MKNLYPFTTPVKKRHAFTLIELLVVIGVIAVISSIGIFAFKPFQSQASVNNAAALLQTWLNTAKMRAMRDQRPVGLQLIQGDDIKDSSGAILPYMVTKCTFVEQPDDFVGSNIYHPDYNNAQGVFGPDSKAYVRFTNPKLTDPLFFGPNTPPPPPAQPNPVISTIEINGSLPYTFSSYNFSIVDPNTCQIVLNTYSDRAPYHPRCALSQGSNLPFRIRKPPSPLSGSDEILKLPTYAAINLSAVTDYNIAKKPFSGYPLPQISSSGINIMFSPTGALTQADAFPDKIMLWVGSTNVDNTNSINPMQGQPVLVVIYANSGLVATYPVNIDTTGIVNPFKYVP